MAFDYKKEYKEFYLPKSKRRKNENRYPSPDPKTTITYSKYTHRRTSYELQSGIGFYLFKTKI